MSIGKTLVGGILGAAVAMGLYLLLNIQLGRQAVWFPVVTGLLTGLGVRQAHKSLSGHVSYLRGAISGLIAALAILGAERLVHFVQSQKEFNAPTQSAANAKPAEEGDTETTTSPEPEVVEMEKLTVDPGAAASRPHLPRQRDEVWPFIYMAVGIFLAYEFARGTAPPTVTTVKDSDDSSEETAQA